MYRLIDKKYANRLVFVGDTEIQFRDYMAMASPEQAYKLHRNSWTEYEFPNADTVVPFNPASWNCDRRMIWRANVASANGYGMVAENTIKYLMAQGVTVQNPGTISGNIESGGEYVDDTVKRSFNELIYPDCLEIQHTQPPAIRFGITERIWAYTMFESSHTPQKWIDIMNRLDHVLVPSSWLVAAWREQGLKVPISVYHHGIDTAYFYDLDRPVRDTFTFLHYADLSPRKGSEIVVAAFLKAFPGKTDVRLVMKNHKPFFPFITDDPRIERIHATYSKEQMRELLYRADCFVFPTRGEGFGLTPFEAMASGLPTIVTGWSGPADYADPRDTLILDYKLVPAENQYMIYREDYAPGEDAGVWAEPSLEHTIELMRWAYEHRNEARMMGKSTASRLAREWTWEQKAQQLIDIIDDHTE